MTSSSLATSARAVDVGALAQTGSRGAAPPLKMSMREQRDEHDERCVSTEDAVLAAVAPAGEVEVAETGVSV